MSFRIAWGWRGGWSWGRIAADCASLPGYLRYVDWKFKVPGGPAKSGSRYTER